MPRPPRKPQAPPEKGCWCAYLVECRDGSLYAGATNRLLERVAAHDAGRGARYTRSRRPVRLVFWERAADRSAALRREAALKRLSRPQKQALVAAFGATCSARPSRKPASAARRAPAARAGRRGTART